MAARAAWGEVGVVFWTRSRSDNNAADAKLENTSLSTGVIIGSRIPPPPPPKLLSRHFIAKIAINLVYFLECFIKFKLLGYMLSSNFTFA